MIVFGVERVVLLLLTLVIALSISACTAASNARLWIPPVVSGMERVSPELVLEAPITRVDAEQAEALQKEAKRLLAVVWTERQSSPELWICQTEVCYQRLGGGSPVGKSFGYSRTLMSQRGQTAGILAHEWWHAEFWHRIGLSKVSSVPRWFDEGVAVWISQEPRHSETMYQRVLTQGIAPPKLESLVSFDDWDAAVGRYGDHLKTPDLNAINVIYPTAGHEVRRWIEIVGVDGLRRLVKDLAAGADFSSSYTAIEREAKP